MKIGLENTAYFSPPLAVWLSQVLIVGLLVWINPNHYTTIDSRYYLEAAQNIVEGRGYRVTQNGILSWNSTFPMGYSLLVAIMAHITGLPAIWASKLVNLSASAGLMICFYNWFGSYRATILGSLLLTGPFLKLWAHSWSEPIFILVLVCWIRAYSLSVDRQNWRYSLGSLFLGLLLMGIRYAGIFILACALIQLLQNRRRISMWGYIIHLMMIGAWIFSFLGYLWVNQQLAGDYFGGERFSFNLATTPILAMWSRGLLDQWLDVPKLYPRAWQWAFQLLHCIQVILCGFLFFEIHKNWKVVEKDTRAWAWKFAQTGFIYLFFLFILRFISPFDAPGYRLLAPFSALLFWGLLLDISDYRLSVRARVIGFIILLISWISLFPSATSSIKWLQLQVGRGLVSVSFMQCLE